MANAWMNHVRNFRQRNSKLSYREVLKQARKTYGGGIEGDTRSVVAKNAGIIGGGIEGDTRSVVAKYASAVGGRRQSKRGGNRRSRTRRSRR